MKNSALLPPVSHSTEFPLINNNNNNNKKESERKHAPPTNPNAFYGSLRISTEMGPPGDEKLTYPIRLNANPNQD
jgi:hypothetical protein